MENLYNIKYINVHNEAAKMLSQRSAKRQLLQIIQFLPGLFASAVQSIKCTLVLSESVRPDGLSYGGITFAAVMRSAPCASSHGIADNGPLDAL